MLDADVQADVWDALDKAAASPIDEAPIGAHGWDDPLHQVSLAADWRLEPRLPYAVRESLRIGPADLFELAEACRAEDTWLPLLVSVNAWSYGESGYGHWRTRRSAQVADVETRLRAAAITLRVDGPVDAYYLLNNDGYIQGWGPALFTRFLFFADQRAEDRAVILDSTVAEGINRLVPGAQLPATDWSTAEYAFCHALLNRLASVRALDPGAVSAGFLAAVPRD